jgi:hypothetical protein
MASLDVRFAFVSLGCDSSLALPSSPDDRVVLNS